MCPRTPLADVRQAGPLVKWCCAVFLTATAHRLHSIPTIKLSTLLRTLALPHASRDEIGESNRSQQVGCLSSDPLQILMRERWPEKPIKRSPPKQVSHKICNLGEMLDGFLQSESQTDYQLSTNTTLNYSTLHCGPTMAKRPS